MSVSDQKMALPDFYAAESRRIREAFGASGDGLTAATERSQVVDHLLSELFQATISQQPNGPDNLCLVALGGYGRSELFPCSDIDLLFISDQDATLADYRKAIAEFVCRLWDMGLRAAQTCHTLVECNSLFRDNLEFNVALMDLRYIAGGDNLFEQLRNTNLPRLIGKEGQTLINDLIKMTRERHLKYQGTVFHLEPNLKEAPGGLRDLHVARWLTIISELEKQQRWASPETLWPDRYLEPAKQAFQSLASVRCFLHYQQDRDDNRLTYELQEEAAAKGVGTPLGQPVPPEDWMRIYFRHARSIDRLTTEITRETQPARLALYGLYQDWKSRVSNLDFSAVSGKIYLRLPAAARDQNYFLRLFEFVARHGLELSREAERGATKALASDSANARLGPGFWRAFCQILSLPHAAKALRAMHRLGWLDLLFPEFRAIDALVIRDFYHRYTVDEHSFMTIENLNALREAKSEWDGKYREILTELERPQLLVFSLLFHDAGKGMAAPNHVEGSLEAVERIFARLDAKPEESETVRFLIRNHLEMSTAFLRRDIFDPATVHRMAEIVGSEERLKMLCLLTYSDIKSVNPEALTPWKAEMLWRLYTATSNALARSLDSERIHSPEEALSAKAQGAALDETGPVPGNLRSFLEGFPKRYLRTYRYEDIDLHRRMSEDLLQNPIQTVLRNRNHSWELLVLTHDRPYLFTQITGTLAAWGMNIIAADAFANRAGIALDCFRFDDLFHTLDLNPPEQDRMRKTVVDVLAGAQNLQELIKGRMGARQFTRSKLKVPTEIRFDDNSSTHCTLLELVTRDRPGLLYQVGSLLSDFGFDITVALIETQGEKAIDVFYLTKGNRKLEEANKQAIRDTLLKALSDDAGSQP
ncbi:MAG TPA: [protein-PII] uridylyltransferase [Terriglobia bacterium]|nr:[protein-PII] uridylyltransferase [Terriglobia bacterium]